MNRRTVPAPLSDGQTLAAMPRRGTPDPYEIPPEDLPAPDPPPDPLEVRVQAAARAYMIAFRDAEGTTPLAVRLEIAERVARLALTMGG